MEMADRTGLVEVLAITDTFATGVEVEDLENGMRRLLFFAPHGAERHVCAKMVVPAGCLISITEAIAPHAQQVAEKLLTLVPRSNNHTG
jgi:hypothetical protein